MEFDIEKETAYNEFNTSIRRHSKDKGRVCVREINLYNFQLADLELFLALQEIPTF